MITNNFFTEVSTLAKLSVDYDLFRCMSNSYVYAYMLNDGEVRCCLFTNYARAAAWMRTTHFEFENCICLQTLIPLNSPLFD